MRIWILVFMFQGQPMASGPFELDACLLMAATQTQISGYKAHCYDISVTYDRRYPVMEGGGSG